MTAGAAPALGGDRSPPPVFASPAVAQSNRCVFQIDNVDRQGARGRDRQGHQLLRRRQRSAQLPGTQITDAERQRRVLRRQRRPVHRPRAVPRLHHDDGRRLRHLSPRWREVGSPGQRDHRQPRRPARRSSGPALDYFRVVRGVRDTLEMYATGRPKIRYCRGGLDRRTGRTVSHRRRPGALQGERPDLGRREGHHRPQRLRRAVRLDAAGHGEGQRRHASSAGTRRCGVSGRTASRSAATASTSPWTGGS